VQARGMAGFGRGRCWARLIAIAVLKGGREGGRGGGREGGREGVVRRKMKEKESEMPARSIANSGRGWGWAHRAAKAVLREGGREGGG